MLVVHVGLWGCVVNGLCLFAGLFIVVCGCGLVVVLLRCS